MQHIFDSLKVLELASVLAGPSVGQFFAELGAEVIKVENPSTDGDVTRSWSLAEEAPQNGISAYFSSVNSGKRSISIDMKDEEDFKVLLQLIGEADVLITSFKPGDAEKLGLSYGQLVSDFPNLIYAEISGYGSGDKRVGYDAVLQAETGFMYMNGKPNNESIKMPVALIDLLAAHQLKEAILLAYIDRLKNQKGSKVSVSLFDVAVSSLANQATNYLVAGKEPEKMGAEHPNIAPYGKLFSCSDGSEILLAVGNDKQFRSLCKVLRLDQTADDNRFRTNANRVKNRHELNSLLANVIRSFHSKELLQELYGNKVPAGKLNKVSEVFSLPSVNKLIVKNESGEAVGLRNFVAELSFMPEVPHLSPPPPFKQ